MSFQDLGGASSARRVPIHSLRRAMPKHIETVPSLRHRKLVLPAFLSVLLWLASGCMLNPVDGQLVSSTTDTIGFGGYSNTANQRVELQFAQGSAWTLAGATTTTGTRSLVSNDGMDLFGWSLPTALPASAWTPGVTGRFAKVRMLVPGAGAGGRDAFMYTFLSDWSECLGDHPGVGAFISNCRSPRSPVAYIFTRDFPRGTDLEITTMLWTSTGRTEVRVRNGGRAGRVSSLSCSRFGSSSTMRIDDEILPGETKTYFTAVAPAGWVTCTVAGTNEDGSAEANTGNNQRSRSF